MSAKGKSLGLISGVILIVLYSYISFINKFYGEVIINLCIILPMFISGIISWIRHKSEKTNSVEINTISAKEWIIVTFLIFVFSIAIFYLLKIFNTDELIVSTLSVTSILYAVYLQMRRSRFSFYFYLIMDIVLILLWGISVIRGNFNVLPILLNIFVDLINDGYGVYNWKKTEKEQREN